MHYLELHYWNLYCNAMGCFARVIEMGLDLNERYTLDAAAMNSNWFVCSWVSDWTIQDLRWHQKLYDRLYFPFVALITTVVHVDLRPSLLWEISASNLYFATHVSCFDQIPTERRLQAQVCTRPYATKFDNSCLHPDCKFHQYYQFRWWTFFLCINLNWGKSRNHT